MTHLKIEQNNGVTEEVSSTVISKLYDIVHSGNLDNTSNLIGRLHTSATYQDYIDYLEDAFKVNGVKQLIIDATKKYMSFADPVVASYWANSAYGDGTGIDAATAANSVLSIPNDAFKDNTSLWIFDELGRFTNCTSIGNNSFQNCTALTSINLSNCTSIGVSAFNGCTSLTIADLSNITTFGANAFYNSGISGVIDLSNCTTTDIFNGAAQVFAGCSNITQIINIPSTVTTIGGVNIGNQGPLVGCTSLTKFDASSSGVTTINSRMFSQCDAISKIKLPNTVTSIAAIFAYCVYANTIKIYLPCTTPPTLTESQNTNKLNYSQSTFSGGIEVYVPDAEVSTYQNDTDWGVFTIKPISTWVD